MKNRKEDSVLMITRAR